MLFVFLSVVWKLHPRRPSTLTFKCKKQTFRKLYSAGIFAERVLENLCLPLLSVKISTILSFKFRHLPQNKVYALRHMFCRNLRTWKTASKYYGFVSEHELLTYNFECQHPFTELLASETGFCGSYRWTVKLYICIAGLSDYRHLKIDVDGQSNWYPTFLSEENNLCFCCAFIIQAIVYVLCSTLMHYLKFSPSVDLVKKVLRLDVARCDAACRCRMAAINRA